MTSYFLNFLSGDPQTTTVAGPQIQDRSVSDKLNYFYASPRRRSPLAPVTTSSRNQSSMSSRGSSPTSTPPLTPTHSPMISHRHSPLAEVSTPTKISSSIGHDLPPNRRSSHEYHPRGNTKSYEGSNPNTTSTKTERPKHTRTNSADQLSTIPPRPILKQSHTWDAQTGTFPQASSKPHQNVLPQAKPLIHGLLASSAANRPSIAYDVTFTPSSKTVLHRDTALPITSETLLQAAVDPSTHPKLVLKSEKLPWPIIVRASVVKLSGGRGENTTTPRITNLDILYSIHDTLSVRITREEWAAIGHGSPAQAKVTKAYERRCRKLGGGWENGVKRIDFLGGKTKLVGVELDNAEGGTGRLVFGKP